MAERYGTQPKHTFALLRPSLALIFFYTVISFFCFCTGVTAGDGFSWQNTSVPIVFLSIFAVYLRSHLCPTNNVTVFFSRKDPDRNAVKRIGS